MRDAALAALGVAGKDARLRCRVGVDARIAVEMVLGDVEHGGRRRRERGRRFELEAGELEDDYVGKGALCRK